MIRYERYAIYYAPKNDSLLGRFGNAWLGWNPETKRSAPRPKVIGLSSDDIERVTTSPARYGFHGTLKPPFKLAKDKTFEGLTLAIEDLCDTLKPVRGAPLSLQVIGGFLAFTPRDSKMAISALADQCVWKLDSFRSAPSADELARRRQDGLSERQEALLLKWGYPYVMDEFRFHLTLSNKLSGERLKHVHQCLETASEHLLLSPFEINDLCLFGDPGHNRPFHLIRRFSLKAKNT